MNSGFEKIDKPVVRPLGKFKTCSGCGVTFESHSNARETCTPQCKAPKVTPWDEKAISEFRAVCKRYGLRLMPTWKFITGGRAHAMYFWRKNKTTYMTKEYKDRLTVIMFRFVQDMQKGMYDIEVIPEIYVLQYKTKLVRRMTPRPRVCPKNISSCPGAFYKGDCPRNFSACEMSAKCYGKRLTGVELDKLVADINKNLGLERHPELHG